MVEEERGTPLAASLVPEDAGCHGDGDASADTSQNISSPTSRKLDSMLIINKSIYLAHFAIECEKCKIKSTQKPTLSEHMGGAFKVTGVRQNSFVGKGHK